MNNRRPWLPAAEQWTLGPRPVAAAPAAGTPATEHDALKRAARLGAELRLLRDTSGLKHHWRRALMQSELVLDTTATCMPSSDANSLHVKTRNTAAFLLTRVPHLLVLAASKFEGHALDEAIRAWLPDDASARIDRRVVQFVWAVVVNGIRKRKCAAERTLLLGALVACHDAYLAAEFEARAWCVVRDGGALKALTKSPFSMRVACALLSLFPSTPSRTMLEVFAGKFPPSVCPMRPQDAAAAVKRTLADVPGLCALLEFLPPHVEGWTPERELAAALFDDDERACARAVPVFAMDAAKWTSTFKRRGWVFAPEARARLMHAERRIKPITLAHATGLVEWCVAREGGGDNACPT